MLRYCCFVKDKVIEGVRFFFGNGLGLNVFISNQPIDMHMIFTYNDTLGLEWKQHAY